MKKKTVVLFTGKKGTGKTFQSNALKKMAEAQGVKAKIVSFATPLKEHTNKLIVNVFGEEYLKAENKEVIRPIYQSVGMIARSIDPNFWINKAMAEIDNDDENTLFIIDDARFPNELELFDDKYETFKIKIVRDSIYDVSDTDVTETSLDKYPDENYDYIMDESVRDKMFEGILKGGK